MRKLHLNTENLRVESFVTTDAEPARRGTVRAQSGIFSNVGGGCVGYSSGAPVCACDTTHTQRPPECDPSEQTLCAGDPCG
jgi:hypothetical protein